MTMGIVRVDSYYDKVKQLLDEYPDNIKSLTVRLEALHKELAQVVEGVVLRGYPTDMEIIPGHKDPDARIENDIRQIAKETRWCNAAIRQATEDLNELMLLETRMKSLPGQPGEVLRALYVERLTRDALAERLCCTKSNIYQRKKLGIEKLANALYSRISGS